MSFRPAGGEPPREGVMSGAVGQEAIYLVTLWTYGGKALFRDARAAALFCRILAGMRQRLGFRLCAYVLLPERVRFILGARDTDPRWVQVTVQRLKSRFAREANARSGRLGLVWQDADQRLRLEGLEEVARRAEFLHQMPVLAGVARHPAEWRWSSYRAWAGMGRTPAPVDRPGTAGRGRSGATLAPGSFSG
jgi:REP-associated tyrosine transposase